MNEPDPYFIKKRLIKVCGMREARNIKALINLRPDFMGFIFFAESPRNAFGVSKDDLMDVPKEISKVGVFVNAGKEEILETALFYGLDWIQLHGQESPAVCQYLRNKHFKVIKAYPISSGRNETFKSLKKYFGKVDMFLFDTAGKNAGGNGRKFDWKILEKYPYEIPYLLSGGIGSEDLDYVKSNLPDWCVGIDVNSKFETEPGMKDIELLKNFITNFKSE